ncbi:MAG: S16 family serine protease [Nanopusillaceae archaeon]
MKNKEFYIWLFLLISLIFLTTIYFYIKNIRPEESCIYIPAILKNEGVITQFCLKTIYGSGRVFSEIPNVFTQNYQISFIIAKSAICKIIENCDKYDYIFYTKEKFSGEGFSGTAGLATLILYEIYKIKNKQNISITGFVLPNGLILPVGGIAEKLNASLSKNLTLIAPSNYSKDILQAYTILDIENYLLNYQKKNYLKIPEKYYLVLKEIALDICNGLENEEIKNLINKNSFYTAASLCFIEKSKNEDFIYSLPTDLEKEILDFEKDIMNYNCRTFTCEEIKFQILLRINMSKEASDINQKYWRFYTAKGWYKILKEFENLERKNTCKIIENDYAILKYLINENLENNNSCFEKREILSKIYNELFSNYEIDTKKFVNSVEEYLKFLYGKNGFSITSYNYFVYGKDLIEMGKIKEGILYLIYSINYAI